MALRAWALLLVLTCGFAAIGCGDDSGNDDDSNTPRSGSNGGGAGTGNTDKITPAMAISGACEMQDDLSMCMGIEPFTNCVLDTCNLQDCLDGPCAAYLDCLEGASDVCDNDCVRSAACETCLDPIPSCALKQPCIGMLDCD